MRGQRKRQLNWFQTGNSEHKHMMSISPEKVRRDLPFMRLNAEEYQNLVKVGQDGAVSTCEVYGNTVPVRILRPRQPRALPTVAKVTKTTQRL